MYAHICKNQEECGQDQPTMFFYQELKEQKKEERKDNKEKMKEIAK